MAVFLNVGQLPSSTSGHTTHISLPQAVETFAAVGVSIEQRADSDDLAVPTDVVMGW